MEKRSEPNRLEVELVSSGSFAQPPIHTDDGDGPDAGNHGIPKSARLPLAIAFAIVVAVALAVGWAIGSSNGESNVSVGADAELAEATVTSTTPTNVDDTIPGVEPIAAPPEEPSSTPTTTLPTTLVKVEPITIDEPLAGLPYEIVALDYSGRLQLIDLASSTLTSVLDAPLSNGPPSVYAGDDWVLLTLWSDEGESWLYRGPDDTRFVSNSLVGQGPWRGLHEPGSDTFWKTDARLRAGLAGTLEETTFDGTPTGNTITVPSIPDSTDPAGGFVLSAPGGTYRITSEGTSRLTPGVILALGATRLLVHECDEQLSCGYFVIDRASGDRRPLEIDPGLGENPQLRPLNWWSGSGTSVSPGGTLAMVVHVVDDPTAGSQVRVIIDLDSGEFTELGEVGNGAPVVWTSDGEWAFFLDVGRLTGFEVATRETFLASAAEGDTWFLNSLAVRSSP